MVYGFDVDGVLANFIDAYTDLFVKMTGKDLFPERPFEPPCWNYPQHFGYGEDVCNYNTGAVWKHIKSSDDFWERLAPYDWTSPLMTEVRRLSYKGHDVYFVTDRTGINAKRQTERWLGRFFTDPTVIISADKGLVAKALKMHAYVDDRPENIEQVVQHAPNTAAYLFSRGYNRQREVFGSIRVEPDETGRLMATDPSSGISWYPLAEKSV